MEIIEDDQSVDPVKKDSIKDFERDLKAQIAQQFGEDKARSYKIDSAKFEGKYDEKTEE